MSTIPDGSWLSQFGAQRHACAFFNSADEEYRTLMPFIKEGFDFGDRAVHIVDPELRDDHRARLHSAGLDVDEEEQRGRFQCCCWTDAYLRDGRFEQDRMLAFLQETLDAGRAKGFPMTRLVAHMEWATGKSPGVEDLVEYEMRINHMWPLHQDAVICVYDLARFRADTVMDIMRMHPVVVIGGIVQENPFFVPPDEFLRELRTRPHPQPAHAS
jgi:hypothetical protein